MGQCSLTVALPVVSACGVECAILPSAVLSTHTAGKFRECGFSVKDLSPEFPVINDYWKKAGVKFDAVCTGYLGSTDQIDYVLNIADSCMKDGGLLIIDPAMGDGGQLYPAFDMAYVNAMKKLCAKADVVLPNITEASFLTGIEYKEKYDEAYVKAICDKLLEMGAKKVVLTGVSYDDESTGVFIYSDKDQYYYRHKKISQSYHGTGDIYSACFAGKLMAGKNEREAARIAADFVCKAIENTVGDDSHWYGVKFEALLGELANM